MPVWLATLLPIANQWLERAFPDPAEREKQLAKLVEAANQADAAQLEVNKVEAAHQSVFVAGWRPFIGWVCGFALAYHYILQPFTGMIVLSLGYNFSMPMFDMNALDTILMGMLGLGGMRTFEKFKGVTR